MKKFPFAGRSQAKLTLLQDSILAADDRTLKALIDKHGIRKSGADAAALFLKILPLERSNALLKDLPRRRLREAITRIKDEIQLDHATIVRMLGDLKQSSTASKSAATLTTSRLDAKKDADEVHTPFVMRALDFAGRFFGNRT